MDVLDQPSAAETQPESQQSTTLPISIQHEHQEDLQAQSEGYGSGGDYNSDEYNSDGGYNSGYNSDDTAGAQPKTILTNILPVDKMKNGWTVMTNMFGKGLAFTSNVANEAYNSETLQSIKERTSEAAVWTKEKSSESYKYSKEKVAPVLAVTKEKAGEACEVTRGSVSYASEKARPMVGRVKKGVASVGIFPIRPDPNSSAENSEYEGLSPLSTSPPCLSPLSASPPLSPKSSRAESPVQGQEGQYSFPMNQQMQMLAPTNLPEPPSAPGVMNNKVAVQQQQSPQQLQQP
jgi:hypothetical protein